MLYIVVREADKIRDCREGSCIALSTCVFPLLSYKELVCITARKTLWKEYVCCFRSPRHHLWHFGSTER